MTARGRGARPHLSDDETVAKMGHPAAMDGAPGQYGDSGFARMTNK